ncbi:MAG: hypothetical protein JXP34_28895, partial [Planctomycetes bacterium]|nr:hypothetical protein [Planctomycetota bacterium]
AGGFVLALADPQSQESGSAFIAEDYRWLRDTTRIGEGAEIERTFTYESAGGKHHRTSAKLSGREGGKEFATAAFAYEWAPSQGIPFLRRLTIESANADDSIAFVLDLREVSFVPAEEKTAPSGPQPPEGMTFGPWGKANVGTRIRYRRLMALPPDFLSHGPVTFTEEVIAADEKTLTMRVKRTWPEKGGEKSEERENRLPRFIKKEQLPNDLSALGEKVGGETLKIGDRAIACDVFRKVTKEETFTPGFDTVEIEITYRSHASLDIPGWIVRVQGESEEGDRKTVFELLEVKD